MCKLLYRFFMWIAHIFYESNNNESKTEVTPVAELTKRLQYRTKNGITGEIKLYSSSSEAGDNYINLLVDNANAYAALGQVNDTNASDLKVQKNGTTYAILTEYKKGVQEVDPALFEYVTDGYSMPGYEYVGPLDEEGDGSYGLVDEGGSEYEISYYQIPKHPSCSKITFLVDGDGADGLLYKRTFNWADIPQSKFQDGFLGILTMKKTVYGLGGGEDVIYTEQTLAVGFGNPAEGENLQSFWLNKVSPKYEESFNLDSLEYPDSYGFAILQHN